MACFALDPIRSCHPCKPFTIKPTILYTQNLDEVKLLLAVQDGSLERVESLLERYLGDVNSPMTKVHILAS